MINNKPTSLTWVYFHHDGTVPSTNELSHWSHKTRSFNCQISKRVLLTGLSASTIRSQRKFLNRWDWLFLLRARTKFLDGWVAKEIIFTSRARAYNDFRGYWMEDFCSLVHYFNFWESHSWRETRVIEFKVHGNRTKMKRKNLKKIPSYPSEKKWHLHATELCLTTFSSWAPCSFGSESKLKTVDISLKFSSFINGLTDVPYLAEEKRNGCEGYP